LGAESILTLADVYSGYGEVVVLQNISCALRQGAITSVIGANGAGKSTLLKTIFGIVRARGGKIVYDERDITDLSSIDILRTGICLVPQGRCNFPNMTVHENLEMGAFVRRDGAVKADIARTYDRFEMLRQKHKELAGNLSGGQQQILEMAMALLIKPKVLLIDEPTLGLSSVLADEVFEAIRQIRDAGTTVVMVEQNAKRALELSDYAIVLELGKNWLEGTGAQVLADPRVRLHYLGL
jgi:branched-chain amino acid transport system ATP-binding protein